MNRLLFHCDIDYRADLAGGFMIVHGLGIVIGSGVKSNGRLKVYQGVTLGGTGKFIINKNTEKVYMPIVEDNVVIYTDAKVLGPVYLGSSIVIKAGSIITKDIKNNNIMENNINERNA